MTGRTGLITQSTLYSGLKLHLAQAVVCAVPLHWRLTLPELLLDESVAVFALMPEFDSDGEDFVLLSTSGFLVPHRSDGTIPSALALDVSRMLEGDWSIDLPVQDNSTLSYLHGFSVGMLDGGTDVVRGIVDLGKGVWYIVVNYNCISQTPRIIRGEKVILLEDQQPPRPGSSCQRSQRSLSNSLKTNPNWRMQR
ncbi:MAG: hypothetical protein R3B46_12815 [Phycisphaerales bacterium]